MPEFTDEQVFGLTDAEVFRSSGPGLSDAQVFGTPATSQQIDSNPFYIPTRDEFDEYRQEQWNRPVRPGKAASEAVSGLWNSGKELFSSLRGASGRLKKDGGDFRDVIQTVAEAATRGTAGLGRMARGLIDRVASVGNDESEDTFTRRRVHEMFGGGNELDTPAEGDVAGSQRALNVQTSEPAPEQFPPDLREHFAKEYYDYKLDRDYQRFLVNRQVDQFLELTRQGKENILPEVLGKTDQAIAEPLSHFVDLTTLATAGAGALASGVGKGAARAAAGAVAEAAGTALDASGRAATALGKLPERAAGGAARLVGASEEAAAKLESRVAAGQAGLAIAPGVGLDIPGLTPIAQAATGAKVAGMTLDSAGEAASAAGRALSDGPSRIGLLERISKDGTAPLWLRKAAGTASVLDSAMESAAGTAGAVGRGAAAGAAVGAGLGYTLSGGDIEAAGAGAGAGGATGALGGLYGRVASREARSAAGADADLGRWLAGKSAEEVQNIAGLRLSREQALKVADVERWARGVVNEDGGDVQFRYLSDAEFRKQFGSSQKGAELIQGEKPAVFINTGFRGPRSLFHEVFHAIDDLDALDPQRARLNQRLFTETTPDGAVLSRGLFDAADLANFEDSYRQRLGPEGRVQWDALAANDRATRIRKEVRAESFASMVNGASSRELLTAASGWGRRLADSMLLADRASTLGRMRRFIEGAGVEFKASGDPSELFFKNGRPLTNTPEVDAALGDYMRAKRRVVDRLVAGDDETPAVVFDEHAIRANPKLARALAEQHPDWDGWVRRPDGQVHFIAGNPVLASEREIARVQTRRVEGMLAALKAVPDTGGPGIVRDQGNGHWKGSRFSADQVKALQALPDDVLAPSMKARIAQLNELAGQPGQQIVIDYNAALKNRRYSSGISPSTRIAVPLSIDISKAGNFLMDTLDVTHFMRKLGTWQASKPRAFDAWGGDVNGFMRDVFKYLDNHQRALPGATDLDPAAATAIVKRNIIKDLFNVGGPGALSDTGGAPISTKGGKDNLIRSRRFDRIQRITTGEGTPFPIDYYKQKANFQPAPNFRPTSTPAEVIRVTQDQAVADFSRALGLPHSAGSILAVPVIERLQRAQPAHLDGRARAAAASGALRALAEREGPSIQEAIRTGGLNAARDVLKRAVK